MNRRILSWSLLLLAFFVPLSFGGCQMECSDEGVEIEQTGEGPIEEAVEELDE